MEVGAGSLYVPTDYMDEDAIAKAVEAAVLHPLLLEGHGRRGIKLRQMRWARTGAIMLRGRKDRCAGPVGRRSSTQRSVLRRVVLLGAPLALALLEIFHPERPNSAGEAVKQGTWFMWFHIIQVPLIGLIALAVYLLTDALEGRAASASRWTIGVFAVFFSAYDAAAGIGTGYALRNARDSLPGRKRPSTKR
jgi:hypothetical protein